MTRDTVFEKNMEVLEKRYPDLAKRVKETKDNPSYKLIQAKNGKPNVLMKKGSDFLMLYDNDDPKLLNISKKMLGFVKVKNGEDWIENPVNPLENFADKWKDHPERKKASGIRYIRKRGAHPKASAEYKEQIASKLRGSKCRLWKGGLTLLSFQIRECYQYRQWRSDVFTRDDFTCQNCGERGGYLEADHYPKSFSDIFKEYKIKTFEEAMACEELWNINGGQTLCKKCHRKKNQRSCQQSE